MEFVTREKFEALEKRVSKLESSGLPNKNVRRPESLGEFLSQKSPKDNLEKCICVMYFMEDDGKAWFESGELADALRGAREIVPANVSTVLARCAKKRWISTDGKKEKGKIKWRLTKTGLEYVERMGQQNGG